MYQCVDTQLSTMWDFGYLLRAILVRILRFPVIQWASLYYFNAVTCVYITWYKLRG